MTRLRELYVLVTERDTFDPDDGGRPMVFEQYIDGDAASLERVKAFKERLGNRYGRTRIARLQFVDEQADG